jgi:protoheme IX farnesyltransferase
LYAAILVGLTLAFAAAAGMGLVYVVGAVALGGAFLFHAARMWRDGTERRAIGLYRYSITYLAALFVLIAADVFVPIRLPFA